MSWTLVFAKHAQKDAHKLAASGLKAKAQALLAIIQDHPFQNPPPYEKLVVDLPGPIQGESLFNIAGCTKCFQIKWSSKCSACGRTMNSDIDGRCPVTRQRGCGRPARL